MTAPVSGDMWVKLALGAGAVAAVAYIVYRVKSAAAGLGDAAQTVGAAINPANPGNIVNQGVSAVGAAISGNSDWSLGTWIYNATHDDELAAPAPFTGGATGEW